MRHAALVFSRMVLHEYYFGSLQAGVRLSPQSPVTEAVSKGWGSLEAWQKEFAQTGEMHGIGWAILYHDPATDRLLNWWASDDDPTHPIRLSPILVLDVFEHAYMVDYGAGGRRAYVAAFSRTCSGRSWNGGSTTAGGEGSLATGFAETAGMEGVPCRAWWARSQKAGRRADFTTLTRASATPLSCRPGAPRM
jgi:hypothetical protein